MYYYFLYLYGLSLGGLHDKHVMVYYNLSSNVSTMSMILLFKAIIDLNIYFIHVLFDININAKSFSNSIYIRVFFVTYNLLVLYNLQYNDVSLK